MEGTIPLVKGNAKMADILRGENVLRTNH